MSFRAFGLAFHLASLPAILPAQTLIPFVPAPSGCAMAHCDDQMNDLVRMAPPTSSGVAIISHDTASPGKGLGLGCSSNGILAACTYNNPAGDNLVFYTADGARIWSSGSLLDQNTWASAPLINASGDVIATDDVHIVRLNSSGTVLWSTPLPVVAIPISPVTNASGSILFGTKNGPVSAFDSTTGNLVGSIYVQNATGGSNYFDTINTPCVRGNRFYLSMQLTNDPANTGALVAIDLNTGNTANPLTVAWMFLFGGPSGASPLCVGNTLYFDGASVLPGQPPNPQIFAVQDEGLSSKLLWNVTVPDPVPANMALDPRGGFWSLFTGYSGVNRYNGQTGAVIQSLNVTNLVGDPTPNYPYSAITMAGTAADPVMLLGTVSKNGLSSYVIAIDLPTNALLWKVNIDPSQGADSAPSQFPIVLDPSGNPVVVFAGRFSGAYFAAAP